jgi:hypothetical protein
MLEDKRVKRWVIEWGLLRAMMWECVWVEQLDVMMEIPRDCKRERKKDVEMEE